MYLSENRSERAPPIRIYTLPYWVHKRIKHSINISYGDVADYEKMSSEFSQIDLINICAQSERTLLVKQNISDNLMNAWVENNPKARNIRAYKSNHKGFPFKHLTPTAEMSDGYKVEMGDKASNLLAIFMDNTKNRATDFKVAKEAVKKLDYHGHYEDTVYYNRALVSVLIQLNKDSG